MYLSKNTRERLLKIHYKRCLSNENLEDSRYLLDLTNTHWFYLLNILSTIETNHHRFIDLLVYNRVNIINSLLIPCEMKDVLMKSKMETSVRMNYSEFHTNWQYEGHLLIPYPISDIHMLQNTWYDIIETNDKYAYSLFKKNQPPKYVFVIYLSSQYDDFIGGEYEFVDFVYTPLLYDGRDLCHITPISEGYSKSIILKFYFRLVFFINHKKLKWLSPQKMC
jgi:hypothetical protein